MLDTPDPDKETTGLGQMIWVRWACPSVEEGMAINATLRFKDSSERHEIYSIDSRYGWLMIQVPSDEYAQTGGILSYQILLRHNDETLASTTHKLWVEKVEVSD